MCFYHVISIVTLYLLFLLFFILFLFFIFNFGVILLSCCFLLPVYGCIRHLMVLISVQVSS